MKTKTDPKIQKVIFRASRAKTPEITAILVGQPGSFSNPLTVWDSHYAPEYEIQVVRRHTASHRRTLIGIQSELIPL